MWKRIRRITALTLFLALITGFFWPEDLIIPVRDANDNDWNHQTFWHPWGASGVHMGIDIFAEHGQAVISATHGVVLWTGDWGRGGQVAFVLGPKWRLHYYAHMSQITIKPGAWLSQGDSIGSVGDTGNAAGKPPHLHYSIITPIPYPWHWESGEYGWRKLFILNPHEKLIQRD